MSEKDRLKFLEWYETTRGRRILSHGRRDFTIELVPPAEYLRRQVLTKIY